MREFFKGRRRKLGCGLLVVACLVSGLWVRSAYDGDVFRMNILQRQHLWGSSDGEISWWAWNQGSGLRLPFWTRHSAPLPVIVSPAPADSPGFPYVDLQVALMIDRERPGFVSKWIVPHWVIVLVLTLVSGWLILWPSRTRPSVSDRRV